MAKKMSNLHPGFVLKLPRDHYEKLEKIKQEDGIAITQLARIAVADYLRGR